MISTRRGEDSPASEFADSRARAAREHAVQRGLATHTVAENARDMPDFVQLMSMLGLDDTIAGPAVLNRRLAAYVRQVALAVGVPAEATGYEVSDTATAYLALSQRMFARPDQDLMLAWDERLGWYVGVETKPSEASVVVGYLGGAAVQTPAAVARFVADAVAGRCTIPIRPVLALTTRAALANQMALHTGLGSTV
jgi:hypothetical protein